MKARDKVLKYLYEAKGEFVTGAEMASTLAVSRTAIWKQIRVLEREGYEIDCVKKRGYRLKLKGDSLFEAGITQALADLAKDFHIEIYPELDSTNSYMKKSLERDARDGRVVIAEKQSSGRGRLGRNFYSPSNTGLYFTVLFNDNIKPEEISFVTAQAGVAVCEAIESLGGPTCGIKWVNDVYIGGKKIAGILSEASFSLERSCVDQVMIGIGINVLRPQEGFPPELEEIATAAFSEERVNLKNSLVAGILKRLQYYRNKNTRTELIKNYRERSILIGELISWEIGNQTGTAIVKAIDDDLHLVVVDAAGKELCIDSGEVKRIWKRS